MSLVGVGGFVQAVQLGAKAKIPGATALIGHRLEVIVFSSLKVDGL